ncbi:MAG: DMT family transporter [Ruminococcus sp.]
MKSKQWVGVILLIICSFLWGSTFVAQSETGVEPFTYLMSRSVVAVVFILPFVVVSDAISKKRMKKLPWQAQNTENIKGNKDLLVGGLICGVALFLASAAQQIGIDRGTDAGKAGFITAFYLLLVPIFGLFIKKRVRPLHWLCIVLALMGLFLLCMTGGITEFSVSALFSTKTLSSLSFEACDLFVLASAFLFSVQILFIDKYSQTTDCLKLSLIEFAVVAVLSAICMFIFEKPTLSGIFDSWFSIIYAGVLSSGVAYTLQIIGQKYTNANLATMLMSLESPLALVSQILFSLVVMGTLNLPTGYELIGCALMFSAIVISQLPEKRREVKPSGT